MLQRVFIVVRLMWCKRADSVSLFCGTLSKVIKNALQFISGCRNSFTTIDLTAGDISFSCTNHLNVQHAVSNLTSNLRYLLPMARGL